MKRPYRIGTRASRLALVQTGQVADKLTANNINVEIQKITTTGDQDSRDFRLIPGDGFFTKKIEQELLADKIDLAVHSAKDLPSLTHNRIPWMAFGQRESSRDLLITKPQNVLSQDPLKVRQRLIVGTSSPRREFQLKLLFATIETVPFRGNVPTRIQKVIDGEVEATVLAEAGVNRLGLMEFIEQNGLVAIPLPFCTAPCQGIVAVQGEASALEQIKNEMNEPLTEIARAEKDLLALLGGGCQLAVGAKITGKESDYSLNFDWFEDSNLLRFSIKAPSLTQLLRQAFAQIIGESRGPRVWLTQTIYNQLTPGRMFAAAGFSPQPWPLIEIKPTWDFTKVSAALSAGPFDAFAFGSKYAAQIFAEDLWPSISAQTTQPIFYCVGPASAEPLRPTEVAVVVPKEDFGSQSLIPLIKEKSPKKLLFVGSPDSALNQQLRRHDLVGHAMNVYESQPAESPLSATPTHFSPGDLVVLSSPSAVQLFADQMLKLAIEKDSLKLLYMGSTTAEKAKSLGLPQTGVPGAGSWRNLVDEARKITGTL